MSTAWYSGVESGSLQPSAVCYSRVHSERVLDLSTRTVHEESYLIWIVLTLIFDIATALRYDRRKSNVVR